MRIMHIRRKEVNEDNSDPSLLGARRVKVVEFATYFEIGSVCKREIDVCSLRRGGNCLT